MGRVVALFFLPIVLGAVAAAADERVWAEWEKDLRRQCPSHHVEWLADGYYDQVLAEFFATLPSSVRQEAVSAADIPNECAKVRAGYGCEMEGGLKAFRKLGLAHRFVTFLCHRYTCEEMSLCDRIGSGAAMGQ
jgi:hypothetical protein